MELYFPSLAVAARRLGLDDGELAEAVLAAIGCGADEMEAVTMSIIEALQRRGAYHGRLKRAVEDGAIFQMTENGGQADRATLRRPSPSSSRQGAGVAIGAGHDEKRPK